LLAAFAALGGCHSQQAGSAGPEAPTVVVTQPAKRPIIEYAYFTGQIQALLSVQVRARVTGYLKEMYYTPGKEVAKGAKLFLIDPGPYQDHLDIAHAKAAEAKAQVAVAQARVAQAQAQLDLNQKKLARDLEVAKTPGAISGQQLDVSRAAVTESEAALEAAKAAVLSLKASVKAAEANVETAQRNFDWTTVTAEIGGRVDRQLLDVGNMVTADATVLTNMVASKKVYAYFNVDELTCLKVQKTWREGGYSESDVVPVGVALQDEQDYPHKGLVDLVANKFDVGTGTMSVRAVLENPDGLLTPGNFVRVRLPLDKPRDRLLVPDRAVVYDQGDKFLLIVKSDDKVEKRKVTIGPLDPDDKSMRVIEEGLQPEEWAIIQGRQRVRADAPVKAERVAGPKEPAASSAPKKSP
jgi:RND family efflux transporter MFP subunit